MVLFNGLGEFSGSWVRIVRRGLDPPGFVPTTAPVRAGATMSPYSSGRCEPPPGDLHRLLAAAGEGGRTSWSATPPAVPTP